MIRHLLLGKRHIPSRREYKFAWLRGQFALVMVLVGLLYIVIDLGLQIKEFFFYYGLLSVFGLATIALNRAGRYTAANYFVVVSVNFVVFIFADSDSDYGGIFLFCLPVALVALILFGYEQRWKGLFFCTLTFCLGYVAYVYDFGIVPRPAYADEEFRLAFKINLFLSIAVGSFVVFFLLQRNFESETSLQQSEERLQHALHELHESRDRLQLAIDGTRAGIYEWLPSTGAIALSATYKTLLGYAPHELHDLTASRYLTDLLHPDDAARLNLQLDQPGQKASPYQNELRLRMRDGRYRWFSDCGVIRNNEQGEVFKIIGTIIDIHERKEAAARLEEKNLELAKANEELDRFVYSASHDMRAPLASLMGLINLSEKTHDAAELHLYLDMMKKRIRTMEGFIREVTDYSRNARLGLAVSREPLMPVVQEIVRTLAYSSDQGKIRILYQIPDSLYTQTDTARLRVVLSNLIANAFKYHDASKADRFIRCSASAQEAAVEIVIEDNGLGIAPEHQPRIFDMFYRASEKSDGSGLGLYIVRETLQKLKGTISFSSTAGQGTAFTLLIPHQPTA